MDTDRPPTSLWFCAASDCPSQFKITLIDALQSAKVSARLRDPHHVAGPGLVCFAAPTEAVYPCARSAAMV
jgi:hypothetical protein